MTLAVCFKCGQMKWGAFNHCGQCQARPRTDDELALSLAFTDHYFDRDTLQQIGSGIMSGSTPQLPDAWKAKLAPGVQEAKVMLGIDRAAKKPQALKRTKRFSPILILVLLFVVAAMIVGSLLDFIPWAIRHQLGYVVIPIAVLQLLWSWFKWRAKQRGDQNELDVLEETVQEHERGRHDNTEYIKEQMSFIERDHRRTPEVQRLLERARRAIED